MGAPSRFYMGFRKGIGFGIYFDNFPYQLSIGINFLFLNFQIGIGKAYTS